MGRLAPEASFFKDVEAQEYRETVARRPALRGQAMAAEAAAFPAEL